MTTALTLETPAARRALRRCVGLLLRWAEDEAEATDDVDEAGEPGTSAAISTTEYQVKIVRSPDISEAERKIRLARAFDLVLGLSDNDDPGDNDDGGGDG